MTKVLIIAIQTINSASFACLTGGLSLKDLDLQKIVKTFVDTGSYFQQFYALFMLSLALKKIIKSNDNKT